MPTNIELEKKIQVLELTLVELQSRLDETISKLESTHALANSANKDILGLNVKIDGIREDLKEIKRLGEVIVPRIELDKRLEHKHLRLVEVENAITRLTTELHQAQMTVADRLHKNTVVSYGTLITILVAIMGMIASALIGKI